MVAKKKITKSVTAAKTPTKAKDTIYVDVDDEITHIIDKVKASDAKIVALVLPKRAGVLQSLVNMKLLKRSAVSSKKNLVLITTEAGLMPLAGAAGVHVAKSLQSRPEIPGVPVGLNESDVDDVDTIDDKLLDKNESVGSLSSTSTEDDDDDVIEFDNIQTDDIRPVASKGKSGKAKQKKERKLKVPNFERFRLGIVLAVLGVLLLIGGWLLAVIVLPKATVTIKTDTTSVVSSFDFTASVNQQSADTESMSIPATKEEIKKTETEKGTASGQRDEGTRASGEVTLSAECNPSNFGLAIPAGTAVSNGGLNFITQERATLSTLGPNCTLVDSVKVLASENGDKFNIESNKTFSVAGFSSVSGRNASAMSGGTSKIVKFVTQEDVDNAVSRITARQGESVKDELSSELESDKLFALKETFVASSPNVQSSPAVNAEAGDFTVTYDTTYSMLGVKRDDLTSLIKKDVEGEIDSEKQSIIDDGIDTAVMRINNAKPEEAFISFRSTVVAGPELNEDAIKEAIRGKKRGEAESYIKGLVGVQDVTIDYSPFWVYSTPKAAKKINIVIEKPSDTQQEESSNGSNE